MLKNIIVSDGRISRMLELQPDDILLITSSTTHISGIVDTLVVGNNDYTLFLKVFHYEYHNIVLELEPKTVIIPFNRNNYRDISRLLPGIIYIQL